MTLNQISGTLDKYVIDNYSDPTSVSIADVAFDDSSKSKWIAPRYNPSFAKLIGLDGSSTGRQELVGTYTVRCYAHYRKSVLSVADEVKEMLDGYVNGGLWLEHGIPEPPINLEGDLWECTLNFPCRFA